jgi:hypothetical protein
MIIDPIDSDYLRRPDAKGHLKVMASLRDWDPIGVVTANNPDEYDMYSAEIVHMLDAGVSERELYRHLKRLATKHMCVGCNRRRTKEMAHDLVEFWGHWKTEQNLGQVSSEPAPCAAPNEPSR